MPPISVYTALVVFVNEVHSSCMQVTVETLYWQGIAGQSNKNTI